MQDENVITVNDLWYTYDGRFYALAGVDLEIKRGELVGIAGENGSGKTTLVKHFNGILKPTKGTVKVLGKDTKKMSVMELSADVGYVWQNPIYQIFETTIEKEIEFGVRNLHKFFGKITSEEVKSRVEEALEKFGFKERRDLSPYRLTFGEQKLLCIASVWAMRPEIFILDEPTTGVDPETVDKLIEIVFELHKEGHTIIAISHDLSFLRAMKSLIVMHKGKILIKDTVRNVFSKAEIIKKAGVTPPQITEIAQNLQLSRDILTPKEFAENFSKALKVMCKL